MKTAIALFVVLATGCGSDGASDVDANGGGGDTNGSGTDAQSDTTTSSGARTIFVIPMENESSSAIYGNMTNAPYINMTLIPMAAWTTKFTDELPAIVPSEPHYVWMEAGT